MDRLAYIAMTGASQSAKAQAIQANNLANVGTTGFRADLAQARSMQVYGEGYATRFMAMTEVHRTDFSHGRLTATGRDLDVGVVREGFIAVEGHDGSEAYTRAGNLSVDSVGTLRTSTGFAVLGEGGPVVLPPFERIEIGQDGTVTIQGQGQNPEALTQIDRIKLVNPDLDEVRKSEDGLFRRKDNGAEQASPEVSLAPGFLESSNVNAVDAMTQILSLARQFEIQVKMIRTAEENDEAAARLLQIN